MRMDLKLRMDHTSFFKNKRLRLKLERMRVSLQNFRAKWHHVEAKKIFQYVDILILNRLDSKDILQSSKQSHDGFNTKARKNMQTVAPAMFADKIEWRCRNIEGKKIVTGCGEKGTSKTCTNCGFWQPDLGRKKRVQVQKRNLWLGN